jgi:hypothetical protein
VPRSTNVLINLYSLTKHRPLAKEVPSAGASLFAYFFGVEKSKASDGTRPVGFAFDSQYEI